VIKNYSKILLFHYLEFEELDLSEHFPGTPFAIHYEFLPVSTEEAH
jgi:hypothetical protein